MTSLARRLKRIEAVLRPVSRPRSDPNREMTRLALGCLSDEDLAAFQDILDQEKQPSQWTERESSAVAAYTRVFEQAVQSVGYATADEFERSCGWR